MATLNKTTNPTILILIVLLGLIVGYLFYRGVFPENPAVFPSVDPAFLSFKEASFNFSLLDSQAYTALKRYGEYPIQPGGTGRSDPFAAY